MSMTNPQSPPTAPAPVDPVTRARQMNCIASRKAEDHGFIKSLADGTGGRTCVHCGIRQVEWEQLQQEQDMFANMPPNFNYPSGPQGYP